MLLLKHLPGVVTNFRLLSINHNKMRQNTNVLVSALFAEAQRYVDNATAHPEIQKKMNALGFSARRILEGSALLDAARAGQIDKHEKYSEQQQVSARLSSDFEQARLRFREHVRIVRFALRHEPAMLASFNVQRLSFRIEPWLLQAGEFYRVAASHSELLDRHGLSVEEVSQAKAGIEALSAQRNQRMRCKGDAQEATRLRDTSLKALKRWMSDFRAIARIALRDSPQLMEALGMVVKAEKV